MNRPTVHLSSKSSYAWAILFCALILLAVHILGGCAGFTVPLGRPALETVSEPTVTATNYPERIAKPTETPAIALAAASSPTGRYVTRETSIVEPSLPTRTPDHHYIASPTPKPPMPTWETGFVACDPETSAARLDINCWQGVMNGDNVFIRAGKELYWCEKGPGCGEEGFYDIRAWKPDGTELAYYAGRNYTDFGPLHIVKVMGSLVAFQRDDGSSLSIDIDYYLQ